VVEWHTRPAQPAQYYPFPSDLHPVYLSALKELGIQELYTHQWLSWKHAKAFENIVVTTGTASGKSLCYNLAVVDRLLKDENVRALYIFPTKALAQDQQAGLKKIEQIIDRSSAQKFHISPAIYDGDTPSSVRANIRSKARIILTNPDMLHTGVLPHHTIWAEFFRGLQYVVIDEMHVYRGVFGSHVANVLRRLMRIAKFYGADPQFFLTSATIGNAQELAERLIEAPVKIIDEDGSGRGPRHFLIYNPPIINPDLGIRRSVAQESVRLAEDLLADDVQTIIFGRTRRSVELILTYMRGRFEGNTDAFSRTDPKETVRGYRSGYLPTKRREIEGGLRAGDIRAVAATNALELGIDIGRMGAALLAGYPGTIAATWQQAGRAGRGDDPALAVLVTSADPLDQFLARYPSYFFDRPHEQGLINPDNPLILLGHLRCAVFELPFTVGDGFGNIPEAQLLELLDYLSEEGLLHRSGNKYYWMFDQYPSQSISLRSASTERVRLFLTNVDDQNIQTIGEVDRESATWMVHPGAIYLHEGKMFYIRSLDLEQGKAFLENTAVDYYTEAQSETTVELIEKSDEAKVPGGFKGYGDLKITTQVKGFRKIHWQTHENLGQSPLNLPPGQLVTTGYWITLSDEAVEQLRANGMWSNTPNNYGTGWGIIRLRVRERDDYRCQNCGLLEATREHDVHHKIPFRAFTSAEEANKLSNLVTLCPTCHRRVETAVRVRSGLAGLSFVLGQLAPLFLMCDTRDLGVYSDFQAALSDGHPAVVLYDLVPAGIGFSQRLFEVHSELLTHAYELVASCSCTDGCPSCVGPGGESGYGGRAEALALLQVLSGINM
jgi:DEAD/DEAH box helicase domain-containing protein